MDEWNGWTLTPFTLCMPILAAASTTSSFAHKCSLLAAVGEVVVPGAHVVVGPFAKPEHHTFIRCWCIVELRLKFVFFIHGKIFHYVALCLALWATNASVGKKNRHQNEKFFWCTNKEIHSIIFNTCCLSVKNLQQWRLGSVVLWLPAFYMKTS